MEEIAVRGQSSLFDPVYQGLGGSTKEDTWPVYLCASLGLKISVSQSFPKNFGLYEGCWDMLYTVKSSVDMTLHIEDYLGSLVCEEFLSSPAVELVSQNLYYKPGLENDTVN